MKKTIVILLLVVTLICLVGTAFATKPPVKKIEVKSPNGTETCGMLQIKNKAPYADFEAYYKTVNGKKGLKTVTIISGVNVNRAVKTTILNGRIR